MYDYRIDRSAGEDSDGDLVDSRQSTSHEQRPARPALEQPFGAFESAADRHRSGPDGAGGQTHRSPRRRCASGVGSAADTSGPERRRALLRARLLQRAPEAIAAAGRLSRGAQVGAHEVGRGPEHCRGRRRQSALLAGGGVREQTARPLQSADASARDHRAERRAHRDSAREQRRRRGAARRVR